MRNAARKSAFGPSRKSPLGPPFRLSRKSPLGPPFFKGGKEEGAGWGRSPFRKGGVGGGFLLLLLLALPAHAAPPDLDTLGGWIETYGRVEPAAHAGAKRAEEIFERLVRVADNLEGRRPELAVVGAGKAFGQAHATALPDDSVVVTTEMLDLCFGRESHTLPRREKKRQRREAWLAWLLAHEIAHVALRHFDQQDSARGLAGSTGEVDQTAELWADYQGMLYMLQAGFDPDELFEVNNRFFTKWQEERAEERPDLEARDVELEERLEEIREDVPYFQWGTRLLQLGRFEESIHLLTPFSRQFPSREVLSNLGLAHYQLSADFLSHCKGGRVDRFMLPTRIDPRTLVDRTRWRGGGRATCYENTTYMRNLQQAVSRLQAAVEKDPQYLPARFNLVAAHLLNKDGNRARLIAEELDALAPDDPGTANANALADYLVFSELDHAAAADRTLRVLDEAWQKHPEATYLLFNQARILDELERPEAAKKLWQTFLEAEPSGPWANVARERLGQGVTAALPSLVQRLNTAPLPLGPLAGKGNRMFGLERQPIDKTSSLRGAFHSNHDEERYALEIDGAVRVVEQRRPNKRVEDLRERHGDPAHRLPLHRGELLVWPGGYAAEIEEDGSVWAEIWYVP
jgi:tetratricopeptide (TPR) repeat protein